MTFDNKSAIYRFNVRRYVVVIIYISLVSFFALMDSVSYVFRDVNKVLPIISVTLLYVGFILYNYIKNFTYIYFNDQGSKLIIRFVSMRPFDNRRNSIEVIKENFYNFQIKKSFANLKQDIVLVIKTGKGTAKYPPISLSALNKEQKRIFFKVLSDHSHN